MLEKKLLERLEKLELELKQIKEKKQKFNYLRKAFAKTNVLTGVVLSFIIVTSVIVYAATVSKPYNFTGGTTISASEVNSNFDTLYTLVNGNLDSNNLASDQASLNKVSGGYMTSNNGNVGIGTSDPQSTLDVNGKIIRSIHYAKGKGDTDSTDTGYLISRILTFDKKKSATVIRVLYTDTFRVNGTTKACRWEMRFNNSTCPGGMIAYDRYVNAGAQSTDIHSFGTVVGYCSGLSAGSVTVKIYVSSTPGYSSSDCNTGWNGDSNGGNWLIEAEELY